MDVKVNASGSLNAEYIETIRKQFYDSLERPYWYVPVFTWTCDHDLKTYVGFREVYRYCTKCDHKEDVPK